MKDPVLQAWHERRKDAEKLGFDQPSSLSIKESVNLMLKILEEDSAIIVIDALDECRKPHEILNAFDELLKKAEKPVKIFVSSRDDGDIVCRLALSPNVIINPRDNMVDIRRFISVEVDKAILEARLLRGQVSTGLKDRIIKVLDRGAQGM